MDGHENASADKVGELHDSGKSCGLQQHPIHDSGQVYNACDTNVSHFRETFFTPRPGRRGASARVT